MSRRLSRMTEAGLTAGKRGGAALGCSAWRSAYGRSEELWTSNLSRAGAHAFPSYCRSRRRSMNFRVLIADDHGIVRQGLRALLEKSPEVFVVGEASDGREAVRLAAELQPNIVVMDIA